MARGKRLFSNGELAFMILPVAWVASWWVYPQSLIYVMHAVGRTGRCSAADAVRSPRNVKELESLSIHLQEQSRAERVDNSGLVRWTTPEGVFWAPPDTAAPFLVAEQEVATYGEGQRGVQKGDIVVDCGANIGTFVHRALKLGAARVVAVEPSGRNIECLRRNFASEIAEGRVIVYPKGVWHKEETLTMWVYGNSALDSFVMTERGEEKAKPRAVPFPVTTIDKLVSELNLGRVDFLKMDVEGAERNALEGAQATLARFHPRAAIATENLVDDQVVVPQLMRKAWSGYREACGRCLPASRFEIRPEVIFFF